MKTVLLTVATDPANPYFQNWLRSAKQAGWTDAQVQVLGKNEPWQGWTWRCQKIVQALQRLDPNDLVVFCDSYDLLCLARPTTLSRSIAVANVIFCWEWTTRAWSSLC